MRPVGRQGNAGVRRARGLVGLALGVATWAAVGLPTSDAAESPDHAASDAAGRVEAEEEIVVVAERDTLWDLARVHAPEGADHREWAAEVADHNGVDPRDIRPGDVLRVPADSGSGAFEGSS